MGATPGPSRPATASPTPTPASRSEPTRLTAILKGQSPAGASDTVWVPLVSGVLILAAGAMGLAMDQPWLFAGLAPTAVMLAHAPADRSTRFHTIVLGHAVAIACAFLTLLLLGATDAPVGARAMPLARVWASAFAVALTTLVQPPLRAFHPPAAATALLITLGMIRLTWTVALSMLGGVLAVALLGEWLRRARLRDGPDAMRSR